jgi:hypothetical protein
MSTLNTEPIQNRRRAVSAPRSQSVAIVMRRSDRLGNALVIGALAGAMVGLVGGTAGSLAAQNVAPPVLLGTGVFFGIFNGALLAAIATFGNQRPA